MLGGAITVLITGQITPIDALKSINIDVILFLFGMFVVGEALDASGYLEHLLYKFFKKAKTVDKLVLFVLFGMGLMSAILMNDTLAIVGTPAVLLLSKKHKISSKVLLLALAFSITIGSVLSPIGNPQNLLISMYSGMSNPFIQFLKFLLIPTIINLFAAFILLKLFYKEEFHSGYLNHSNSNIKDKHLALLSKISLFTILTLIIAKIFLMFFYPLLDFKLTYIALVSALPILLFSNKRFEVAKNIDWYTLVFFASMFVLMQSVWDTGVFQSFVLNFHIDVTSIVVIFLVGVLLSQLISNVPLVALFLPLMISASASSKEFVALAASSTIAGNLLILGAASNVIIIQNAEKKTGDTITFLEFAKIGIPLTIINVAVYYLFFKIF